MEQRALTLSTLKQKEKQTEKHKQIEKRTKHSTCLCVAGYMGTLCETGKLLTKTDQMSYSLGSCMVEITRLTERYDPDSYRDADRETDRTTDSETDKESYRQASEEHTETQPEKSTEKERNRGRNRQIHRR